MNGWNLRLVYARGAEHARLAFIGYAKSTYLNEGLPSFIMYQSISPLSRSQLLGGSRTESCCILYIAGRRRSITDRF